MQKKMVMIFTVMLIILGSNFVFAQEKKTEHMMDEGQQMMMPSLMQENMKMMGDMMVEMSKMMGEGQVSPENQKEMCNMMRSMGCMMQTMESGCAIGTLKKQKEELGGYQNNLEKMAEEF